MIQENGILIAMTVQDVDVVWSVFAALKFRLAMASELGFKDVS